MNPIVNLSATLRRMTQSLGAPGLIGLALILGAIVFLKTSLEPLEARRDALEARLAEAERHHARSKNDEAARPAPGTRVAAFYAFFERGGAATDELAKIHAIAQKLHVLIPSTDYKLAERRGGRLETYALSLPVAGTYAQVRAFAANLLVEIPIASLDRIEFKRRGNDAQTVDATIELTLYLSKL